MALHRDTFRRLCVARNLLRDAHGETLSVERVAELVTISRFHFIRQFEALFGTTPNDFRTAWRIERARELLARGTLTVTEVCMAVGFTSLGSFSALFKRRVGETPSAFQERMRALAVVPGEVPHELRPGCMMLMQTLPSGAFRNSKEA